MKNREKHPPRSDLEKEKDRMRQMANELERKLLKAKMQGRYSKEQIVGYMENIIENAQRIQKRNIQEKNYHAIELCSLYIKLVCDLQKNLHWNNL